MNENTRRQFMRSGLAAAAGAAMLNRAAPGAEAIEPLNRPFGKRFKLSLAGYSYRKYLQGDPRRNIPATMTIEEFLDECAKLGLGASEPTSYYFPNPVTEEFLLGFRRRAFLLGLDISGTAVGNTFTYPPGPQRDEQLASVKQWIDYAAVFGAPCIRIFAGRQPDGVSYEDAVEYCVETTQAACDYAATKGVFLALENHGGIVAEPDGVLAIVNRVESGWFGVNFDSGNFHTEDPYADLARIAPYAVNAQVKTEIRRAGGGREEADMERILAILAEADYRGYVALEYEAGEEPKEAVPRYLETLQTLIDKM